MSTTTVPQEIREYLANRYDLEDSDTCVRYSEEPELTPNDGIECYGVMPNTNETAWFFAGFENEILTEMDRG